MEVKTGITQAMKLVFDGSFYIPEFQNLHIDIEFPVDITNYPGIWCDFEVVGAVSKAGIDEFAETYIDGGNTYALSKWRFQGYATYTLAALHSLERDRLFDAVTKVLAFNETDPTVANFRSYIENNPLIAMNMDFDNIAIRGMSAAPGTPWGTNDVIYEVTMAMETVGEFVSDSNGQVLYPIAAIELFAEVEGQTPPTDERITAVGTVPGGTPSPTDGAWK